MRGLTDGVVLYHGSYCEVRSPDLGMCAKYKDFGRGFYLTSSLEQFLLSDTGKLLYEEELKLWWDGPSSIVEMFEKEMKTKSL